MPEKIPRRLRRFRRKGEEPQEIAVEEDLAGSLLAQMPEPAKAKIDKDITMHLTLEEVRKFKAKHKRYPKEQEYDQIAESIYQQLKDKERRKRIYEKLERERKRLGKGKKRRSRKGEEEEAVEELPAGKQVQGLREEEIRELSVADIFAAEKKQSSSKGPGKGLEEELSLAGLDEEKAGQKCPTCGKAGSNIVFCPGCGTAFCSLCAKGTEKIAGKTMLACPSCGKRVRG